MFRVARDHDGSGLVCPSCRRLLRIPGADDVVPPLLVEQLIRGESQTVRAADGNRNVRRKKKRKRRTSESPAWEEKGRRVRSGYKRHGLLSLFIGLIVLLAILGIVISTTLDDGDTVQDGQLASPEVPLAPLETTESPSDANDPDATSAPDADPGGRSDSQFLSDAHPVARAFLEASSVEELLKVVDRPDVVAERIKRYHPDGVIDPPGLGDYSHFSQVRRLGPYGIVPLRTGDFQIRMMFLRADSDSLKVDWESWVGWSDTAWDEFIENRPSGPHVFRVSLGAVEYYNFEFNDDRKWQSYRLISPDEKHSLYGYAEKNSPLNVALRAILEQGLSKAMVEIRFAEDASTSEQVEITRLIAEDWIDPERITEP